MKREFFNQQFAALASAFTVGHKLPDEAQDTYWEMLKDVPDDAFGRAVRTCLAECKFFPTIAELGAASFAGDIHWLEQIARIKRLEYQKTAARLAPPPDPPIPDCERHENQSKVVSLADMVAKQLDNKSKSKIDLEQRKALLHEQAEKLRKESQ